MQKDCGVCAPEWGNNCYTEEMRFVLSWSMAPWAQGSRISFFSFLSSFVASPTQKEKKILLDFFYQNNWAGQF